LPLGLGEIKTYISYDNDFFIYSNDRSAMAVNFPVGIPDPEKRLQLIKENMQELQRSTSAITAFKIQPLIGGLFYWMVKPLAHVMHPTVLSSDFPGPTKSISVDGFRLVDLSFIGGFPPGNVGK